MHETVVTPWCLNYLDWFILKEAKCSFTQVQREKASSVSKEEKVAEAVAVPDGCFYLTSRNSCHIF